MKMYKFISVIVVICCVPLSRAFLGFGVSKEDVSYVLFTKQNHSNGIVVDSDIPVSIGKDKTSRTVFIIHGWLDHSGKEWFKKLTDAYLSKKEVDYQVVQVDWSVPARQVYPASVHNIRAVADRLAHLIVKLWILYDVPLENFELTGHSLGAHICGLTGQAIQDIAGRKLRRITGLDPAGPLFEWKVQEASGRLSSDDAEVVVVVYTDKNVFGYSGSCGTIEFYPNGGTALQPGCLDWNVVHTVPCSHFRAYQYFEEALRTNQMVGVRCKNYAFYKMGFCKFNKRVRLGGDIHPWQTGTFYFETYSSPPYSITD